MESLIGKKVKLKYEFPLDNEVFEIIGERKNQIEVEGDISAGTHNVYQSEWVEKTMIQDKLICGRCERDAKEDKLKGTHCGRFFDESKSGGMFCSGIIISVPNINP